MLLTLGIHAHEYRVNLFLFTNRVTGSPKMGLLELMSFAQHTIRGLKQGTGLKKHRGRRGLGKAVTVLSLRFEVPLG